MDKKQVIRALGEMASLMEIAGAGPYEVIAYRNGAESLSGWNGDLEAAAREETLIDLPRIGKSLARVIGELVLTGSSTQYESLKQRVPVGLLELTRVPGLGPKKIKVLHEKLAIADLDGLERAVTEGRISDLAGFGKRTEAGLVTGIERARERLRRGY